MYLGWTGLFGVARRFVKLPRVEQVLLIVAIEVVTVRAQKSGIEKVEVEGGGREWMVESSVVPAELNAEIEEAQTAAMHGLWYNATK